MKPFIGMTAAYTAFNNLQVYKTNQTYVEAIIRAGGIPVMLPAALSAEECVHYAQILDGLLVPGGDDVSPYLYGEETMPQVTYLNRHMDLFEIELIRKMATANKPVLGICRGHQIINVAFGGTLYQDLDKQVPEHICHLQSSAIREEPFHKVSLEEHSRLASIFGQSAVETNTYHHQAVKDVAPSLKIVGRTSDGVVEAIESESQFIVGVQWHPEGMACRYPVFDKLFQAFIKEAVSAKNE